MKQLVFPTFLATFLTLFSFQSFSMTSRYIENNNRGKLRITTNGGRGMITKRPVVFTETAIVFKKEVTIDNSDLILTRHFKIGIPNRPRSGSTTLCDRFSYCFPGNQMYDLSEMDLKVFVGFGARPRRGETLTIIFTIALYPHSEAPYLGIEVKSSNPQKKFSGKIITKKKVIWNGLYGYFEDYNAVKISRN